MKKKSIKKKKLRKTPSLKVNFTVCAHNKDNQTQKRITSFVILWREVVFCNLVACCLIVIDVVKINLCSFMLFEDDRIANNLQVHVAQFVQILDVRRR